MAYQITDGRIGSQPIADTSTVQNHKLGTIVRAVDSTYGEGEFIYLVGVASTVVGDAVTYNSATHVTTRAAVGANKSFPIAFAMSDRWIEKDGCTAGYVAGRPHLVLYCSKVRPSALRWRLSDL